MAYKSTFIPVHLLWNGFFHFEFAFSVVLCLWIVLRRYRLSVPSPSSWLLAWWLCDFVFDIVINWSTFKCYRTKWSDPSVTGSDESWLLMKKKKKPRRNTFTLYYAPLVVVLVILCFCCSSKIMQWNERSLRHSLGIPFVVFHYRYYVNFQSKKRKRITLCIQYLPPPRFC